MVRTVNREERGMLRQLTLEALNHGRVVCREAIGVHSIPHQDLIYVPEVEPMSNADPHVILFTELHLFIEEPHVVEAPPPQADSRRRPDPVTHTELVQNVPTLARSDRCQDLLSRQLDLSEPRVHGTDDLSATIECGDLLRQLRRKPFIVVIQEGNVLAAGIHKARVASTSDSAIDRMTDITDTRIRELCRDRLCVVCRGVVDDHDLQVGVRLVQHTLDGRPKETGSVVSRNDYAYARHRKSAPGRNKRRLTARSAIARGDGRPSAEGPDAEWGRER